MYECNNLQVFAIDKINTYAQMLTKKILSSLLTCRCALGKIIYRAVDFIQCTINKNKINNYMIDV